MIALLVVVGGALAMTLTLPVASPNARNETKLGVVNSATMIMLPDVAGDKAVLRCTEVKASPLHVPQVRQYVNVLLYTSLKCLQSI